MNSTESQNGEMIQPEDACVVLAATDCPVEPDGTLASGVPFSRIAGAFGRLRFFTLRLAIDTGSTRPYFESEQLPRESPLLLSYHPGRRWHLNKGERPAITLDRQLMALGHGLAKLRGGPRSGVLRFRALCEGQVTAPVCVIRNDLQGCLVVMDRLIELPYRRESVAQVVVSFGIVGIQPKSRLKLSNRSVEIAQ